MPEKAPIIPRKLQARHRDECSLGRRRIWHQSTGLVSVDGIPYSAEVMKSGGFRL